MQRLRQKVSPGQMPKEKRFERNVDAVPRTVNDLKIGWLMDSTANDGFLTMDANGNGKRGVPKLRDIIRRQRQDSDDGPECPDLDFVYDDADTHTNEIAELYSYTEQYELQLNVKAFEDQMEWYKLRPWWQNLTRPEQKSVIYKLLDQLEVSNKQLRMKAARCVLYLAQGCWAEVQSDKEQQDWTKTNVMLLYEAGIFPAFVELLNIEIENSTAANSAMRKLAVSLADSVDLRVILSVLYIIAEVMRVEAMDIENSHYKENVDAFKEELINPYGEELLVVKLLGMVTRFCSGSAPHFPMKKVVLLLWKLILVSLGGIDTLRKLKAIYREEAGLGQQQEDTIEIAKGMRASSPPASASDLIERQSQKRNNSPFRRSLMKQSSLDEPGLGPEFEGEGGSGTGGNEGNGEMIVFEDQPLPGSYMNHYEDQQNQQEPRPSTPQPARGKVRLTSVKLEEMCYCMTHCHNCCNQHIENDIQYMIDVLDVDADDKLDMLVARELVIKSMLWNFMKYNNTWSHEECLGEVMEFMQTEEGAILFGKFDAFKNPMAFGLSWPNRQCNKPVQSLPWTPKVRQKDVDTFLEVSRLKFVGYKLQGDRESLAGLPQPIHEGVDTLKRHMYTSLAEIQVQKEEEMARNPISTTEPAPKQTPTEILYQAILANLPQYMIALLKILLAASPTSKAKTDSINIMADVLPEEMPMTVLQSMKLGIDVNRHKEIIVKAVSAILLLLLKHFKLNHVYQFEFMSQHLVFANCIPLVLKFFNQNIMAYIEAKNIIPILDFPVCVIGDQPELTVESLEIGDSQTYSWRNVFSCINLLRILNKLTKWKHSRVMMLVVFKSAPILKRTLKVRHAMMQLYVLKMLKMQTKYLGRQWRKSNMKTISAIYAKVRHRLNDDWAYGNDLEARPWDFQDEECTLRACVDRFNNRRYTNVARDEELEPVDTSITSVLGANVELADEFKQHYELWLQQEVFQATINWDELLDPIASEI